MISVVVPLYNKEHSVVATIESLGSRLLTGIACGMQPLAANMHGAGKFKRQNRFGVYGYQTAFAVGILLMLFSFAVHNVAPGWMGIADETADLAAHAIMLSAPAFIFLGVIRVAGFYYQSTGQIGISSWLIYGDSFLALPLCLYTLPLRFGLNGVWLAMPASRILLAILLLLGIRHAVREGIENHQLILLESSGLCAYGITAVDAVQCRHELGNLFADEFHGRMLQVRAGTEIQIRIIT